MTSRVIVTIFNIIDVGSVPNGPEKNSQMKAIKFWMALVLLSFSRTAISQVANDSVKGWNSSPTIKLSGFVDAFYVYDFNEPANGYRQGFLFNHNRHNEVNINLSFIKIGLEHDKYRANLALQAGTYPNDNYALEPGLLKTLYEANVGISLNKKNNLWLDAGVMPSHLGFESAVSSDNYTLTRSLSAESSPYFLSGAKLTFTANKKAEMAVMVCNGWQRIKRVNGNSIPSFGTQFIWNFNRNNKLNWSTFIGTDDPDSTRRMRYFNNVYGQFQLSDKLQLIAGFDFGVQQRTKSSNSYNFWLTPTLVGQIQLSSQWKMGLRAEYYHDESGVIISTVTPNGFQTTGCSLNADFSPIPNVALRVEGRWLNSRDAVFTKDANQVHNNFILAGSLSVKIDSEIK